MGTARVITMSAQPTRMSYLCFEIGGILETRSAQLGQLVNNIPFLKLSDYVKTLGTVAGDPSRLRADAQGVMNLASEYSLAMLRNEDRKASLDSAVNSRQNMYFSKYANSAAIISTIQAYYAKTSPTSKPSRLERLSEIAQQQAMDLQEAYTEDDRLGVVRSTSSSVETEGRSKGEALRAGRFYQESAGRYAPKGSKLPRNPPIPWDTHPNWGNNYQAWRFTAPEVTPTAVTMGVNWEDANNSNRSFGTQQAFHVDYEYKTPYLEARARNNRAQISLMDQQFESYMFEQNIPHLKIIFENELASIDNDVHQLQIALLRSFLISPMAGIVTGIYKHPGEAVSAGEPILRVEDNAVVHLTSSLVHPGPIQVGASVTIITTLAGAASAPVTMTGNVVAARGQDSGSRWEVIVRADNQDGAGNHILPLGYHFDAEYTSVTIV